MRGLLGIEGRGTQHGSGSVRMWSGIFGCVSAVGVCKGVVIMMWSGSFRVEVGVCKDVVEFG
jgi:hypothetical protein